MANNDKVSGLRCKKPVGEACSNNFTCIEA